MTKLRKQRRRKVFRHNVNRKRLRNKINSVGNIGCDPIKNAWERHKSVQTNLEEMGLSYDPNKTIKIPSTKKKLKASLTSNTQDEWHEENVDDITTKTKLHVMESLEAEAKAPREKMFRLPNSQVEWVTYLLKKYGNDYRAMARDKKNYNQETWKQIRAKIKLFKKIPEQFEPFLKKNNFKANDFKDDVNLSDDEI